MQNIHISAPVFLADLRLAAGMEGQDEKEKGRGEACLRHPWVYHKKHTKIR